MPVAADLRPDGDDLAGRSLDAALDGFAPGDPHVVIVGAGFAGLACAKVLGRRGVRLTVIDRTNYHLFQPLLYQVATAALSPADIAQPIRHILNRYSTVRVAMGTVTGVDPAARRVRMGANVVSYSHLVLATGARHGYFGHPAWERHAPGLKTIEEARTIRARLLLCFEQAEMSLDPEERARLMTIVVVGGGPTGVEMAGAAAELARFALARDFRNIRPAETRILLLEAAPRILPQFPETLSAYAVQVLTRLGVTVRTDTPVADVDAAGVTIRGEHLGTGLVIWAAGVAASPVGAWLEVPTDRAGRVTVNPDFSVPGVDGVFILGDAALAKDADSGRPLPGLAQVARQQGDWLGRTLAARIAGSPSPGPFRYRDRGNLATIGRNAAVADIRGWRFKGFGAWLLWGLVHVYLLVGGESRLLVTLQWLWAYLTYQRGARIIAQDALPPADASKAADAGIKAPASG